MMPEIQMSLISLLFISIWVCTVSSITILEGPTNTASDLGTYARLTCRVADQGSEPVRWFRIDNKSIISTDSKIIKRALRRRLRIEGNTLLGEYHLVFRQVTRGDNGTYACGVYSTETRQTIMSPPVSLIVVEQPTCSLSSSESLAPGVTVTLSCASHNPGLDVSLSWHRPAEPEQVIFGSTNVNQTGNTRYSQLNITLRPTDFGESYMCKEASLREPTFSKACTITPLETNVPVILFPKQMQAVQGQDVSFRCIIASKNPLTYEWYINGLRDYNARKDKYLFSPVTLDHNNTRVECRTRDDIAQMTGNASSILYVYPKNIPSVTTEAVVDRSQDSSSVTLDTHFIGVPQGKTTQSTADKVTSGSQAATSPEIQDTAKPVSKEPSVNTTVNNEILRSAIPPSNVARDDLPSGLGSTSENKWSNMMVPVIAIGSVIAVLLVCVIVVLLLFLVRQNRVAHGSTADKDDSRKSDIHMDELRHPDVSPANRTLNSESAEMECDDTECLGPKYFTLEPGKRKVRRLERTCSHMIMNDSASEYNVLRRDASLRTPAGVQMNDYVRPDSQISTGDGDMSTVAAYAITDVTLGGGTSSLRRSKSCLRPLPAAPIEAVMNRSHYNIPRDAFAKGSSATESSGDSVTMSVVRRVMSDTLPGAYRRSHVATAFSPAGDEYAEIDTPPRASSPINFFTHSRPNSPDTLQENGLQSVKDFALSLASSYESGYDAASSDDVMDCDMSSPYATIDVLEQKDQSTLPEQTVAESNLGKEAEPKKMPVYAKIKRTRGTQVEDKNIDDDNDLLSEVVC
nr:uncharacterized protein LOC129258486 [Lytechinus pictus]